MVERTRRFINGNPTPIWRVAIVVCLGTYGFLGRWLFVEVVSLPHLYAKQATVVQISKDIKDGFNALQAEINGINKYIREID